MEQTSHLDKLQREAHEVLRCARVAEMFATMYNLECQFGERRDETLERIRRIFPTLTDKKEEQEDYFAAYKRLHAYCRVNNLY